MNAFIISLKSSKPTCFFWNVSFPLDYFKSGWIKWFQNFIIGFRSDWSDQGILNFRGESRIAFPLQKNEIIQINQSRISLIWRLFCPIWDYIKFLRWIELSILTSSIKIFFSKSKSVKIQNRLESLKIGKNKKTKRPTTKCSDQSRCRSFLLRVKFDLSVKFHRFSIMSTTFDLWPFSGTNLKCVKNVS